MSVERFEALKEQMKLSSAELNAKRVLSIHPAFRIIGEHSFIRSFAHSLTHSFTHSPTHWPIINSLVLPSAIQATTKETYLTWAALATPPTAKKPWLTSEIMSLFPFHVLPAPSSTVKRAIIRSLCPSVSDELLNMMFAFEQALGEQ